MGGGERGLKNQRFIIKKTSLPLNLYYSRRRWRIPQPALFLFWEWGNRLHIHITLSVGKFST